MKAKDSSIEMPRYKAEVDRLHLMVELDRCRKAVEVFHNCGLGGSAEAQKLRRAMTDLQLRISDKERESKVQHDACGRSLLSVLVALDLLTTTLDNMERVFKDNTVARAKNSGNDFVAECRRLADSVSEAVCIVGHSPGLDEPFAYTADEATEEMLAVLDKHIRANKYHVLK